MSPKHKHKHTHTPISISMSPLHKLNPFKLHFPSTTPFSNLLRSNPFHTQPVQPVHSSIRAGSLHLFDETPQRSVVSHLIPLTRSYDNALRAFRDARMSNLAVNEFTFAGVLAFCGRTGNLRLGEAIHGLVLVTGFNKTVFTTNSLINMYSKCNCIEKARHLFDTSCGDELDDVSWNSIIAGYVRLGSKSIYSSNIEVFDLLVRMHRFGFVFSDYTLGSVLKACCVDNSFNYFGKMLHGCAIKLGLNLNIVVGTALIDMYAKTGCLLDAVWVFESFTYQNDFMYNAMIAGFLQGKSVSYGYAREALGLFREMLRKGLRCSKFTFSSIVKACVGVGDFEVGRQIHAQICKNDLQGDEFVGSSLVDFYSFFGSIEDALRCFKMTPKLDVVSWTSVIAGCVQNGQCENALSLFCKFLASGRKPDEFIISSVMSACADMAAGRTGEQIQGFALKSGIANSTIVKNSQVCMFAKSGDIDSARMTFQETENPDVVTWSVMICSNAQHGLANEALRLFELMTVSGIEPNQITLLGVLTACSHGGLVEEGLRYFETMKKDYGIAANIKHSSCIVDLLGRAGRLEDAHNFIFDSGFEDDPVMWRALLGACRVHKDTVMGKRVADKVIELEPHEAASYVLLYNIYNDAGKDKRALEVRKLMQDRGVKKEPGMSWIEVGNMVHKFVVDDRSHPMNRLIYSRLEEILVKIKKISSGSEKLPLGISETEFSNAIGMNHHSEKLAVTFGIISLPKSAPVRVMKNLRVCTDCHTTMKLFSEVEKREIILRDAIRFHHFKEGLCSCKDYW